MGRPSEFSNSGLKKPGDIDIIMREGYKKVGYELKDRNFASWTKYKEQIKEINDGYKDIVQHEKLDDYLIMFREKPPQEAINWLNSNNIPWDYYIR